MVSGYRAGGSTAMRTTKGDSGDSPLNAPMWREWPFTAIELAGAYPVAPVATGRIRLRHRSPDIGCELTTIHYEEWAAIPSVNTTP